MCGIAGYVGKEVSAKYLIEKLSRLEYRGYDSAGISNLDNGKIETIKATGEISNLLKKITQKNQISCAISHTRWATHGKISEINAHPHVSKNKTWAVVHNGIIDNFKELKLKFKLAPKSETDTAVISELLENQGACDIDSFKSVISLLSGSWALACINSSVPNKIFFAKNKSPLYISLGANGVMVASDPACFVGFSKEYLVISDGECGTISKDSVEVFDAKMLPVKKTKHSLKNISFGTKDNYKHFMIKEIMEENHVLKELVSTYKNTGILKKFDENFFKSYNNVVFIGCGTAYHAGLYGAELFKKELKIMSSAIMSSELVSGELTFFNKNTLCIAISQSGETADTLQAIELVKKTGAKTIAVTNVMHSTITRSADIVLPTCAGAEVAVASTKAYVCQLVVLYLLVMNLKTANDSLLFKKILELSDNILKIDYEKVDEVAEKIAREERCMYIGSGENFVTSREATLKLKEVSYINAVCYPSGELKHGYLALIDDGFPVCAICLNKRSSARTLNSAEEARARGADVIVMSNDKSLDHADFVISELNSFLAQIYASAICQLIAYNVSIKRGINPDKPKNLAKSVTVE